ncbi:MAG: protein TolB, partial [Myxococcota bacterium]|nr:protein TolB [Myxococcota bacterium]
MRRPGLLPDRAARRRLVVPGVLAAVLLAAAAAAAQDRPAIVIRDPAEKSYRAAVQRFAAPPAERGLADAVHDSALRGLRFSGLFSPLQERAFLGPVQSAPLDVPTPIRCELWKQIGADALVEGEVEAVGDRIRTEYRIRDVSRGCIVLGRRRSLKGGRDLAERMGKAIADDVVEAFTGVPGVADTEIAFVSDRSGNKEIYVMDADGGNLRRATSNGSINTFPSWSPDGEAIVYTTYRYRNRPWLFLLTRGRRSPGRILRDVRLGKIYRGVFSPDGGDFAIVGVADGATELFRVERDGGGLRRITNHRAIDVSPAWSPDGRRMAFVSDRTGAPHIYVMDADGSDVRRLTYDGTYNTNPAWSPDGMWIAYETR